MSTSAYLVAYDIANDRRRTRASQTLKAYGDRIQYSVFLCHLTASNLVTLQADLTELINHHEDQVLFAHLGPLHGRATHAIKVIGAARPFPTDGPTIL
ncbi:MAG: CRISPR-associated endonuclease Cas2 [Myxococcota bacterium]